MIEVTLSGNPPISAFLSEPVLIVTTITIPTVVIVYLALIDELNIILTDEQGQILQ